MMSDLAGATYLENLGLALFVNQLDSLKKSSKKHLGETDFLFDLSAGILVIP